MDKAAIRFERLDFSEEHLIACRKGILSPSILKKLRQRFILFNYLLSVLSLFFLSMICFLIASKHDVVNVVRQGETALYYSLIIGASVLLLMMLWGIFTNKKNHALIALEKINSIDVPFSKISYGVSNNRALIPYLKVDTYTFSPIRSLRTVNDILNKDCTYRFYFSSKSNVLLAVDHIN